MFIFLGEKISNKNENQNKQAKDQLDQKNQFKAKNKTKAHKIPLTLFLMARGLSWNVVDKPRDTSSGGLILKVST